MSMLDVTLVRCRSAGDDDTGFERE